MIVLRQKNFGVFGLVKGLGKAGWKAAKTAFRRVVPKKAPKVTSTALVPYNPAAVSSSAVARYNFRTGMRTAGKTAMDAIKKNPYTTAAVVTGAGLYANGKIKDRRSIASSGEDQEATQVSSIAPVVPYENESESGNQGVNETVSPVVQNNSGNQGVNETVSPVAQNNSGNQGVNETVSPVVQTNPGNQGGTVNNTLAPSTQIGGQNQGSAPSNNPGKITPEPQKPSNMDPALNIVQEAKVQAAEQQPNIQQPNIAANNTPVAGPKPLTVKEAQENLRAAKEEAKMNDPVYQAKQNLRKARRNAREERRVANINKRINTIQTNANARVTNLRRKLY